MKRNTQKWKTKAGATVTLAKSAAKLVRSCKPRSILITLRCTYEDKALLISMANLEGKSLSQFVLGAAMFEAGKIVKRTNWHARRELGSVNMAME